MQSLHVLRTKKTIKIKESLKRLWKFNALLSREIPLVGISLESKAQLKQ